MKNNTLKTVIDGMKFGMMLQFAVGPVCLYVFKSAVEKGLAGSLLVVLSAALVDAFYIFWAIYGVSSFLKSDRIKNFLKYAGFAILLIFGLNIIISSAGSFNLIPQLSILERIKFDNPFLGGAVLTLSSPLTIIFWIGIFSNRIQENGNDRKSVIIFGSGCILSTLIFLSLISFTGVFLRIFLPLILIRILNIAVGLVIIYFGIRLLFKKNNESA